MQSTSHKASKEQRVFPIKSNENNIFIVVYVFILTSNTEVEQEEKAVISQ